MSLLSREAAKEIEDEIRKETDKKYRGEGVPDILSETEDKIFETMNSLSMLLNDLPPENRSSFYVRILA